MAWFRVADHTAGVAVLVDAGSGEEAATRYLKEHPPHLVVDEARLGEINVWADSDRNPYPLDL